MRQLAGTRKSPGERIDKDIKQATCKHYSSEEKIRIVLDGLRGKDSIAELCRREGIAAGNWSSSTQSHPRSTPERHQKPRGPPHETRAARRKL